MEPFAQVANQFVVSFGGLVADFADSGMNATMVEVGVTLLEGVVVLAFWVGGGDWVSEPLVYAGSVLSVGHVCGDIRQWVHPATRSFPSAGPHPCSVVWVVLLHKICLVAFVDVLHDVFLIWRFTV